ncbi:phosphate ABC transporter permease subunit PstC [Proteiniclasticum sp. BAD-10]|uniref:Phosphate transport system permease protein n=1 Tax=Proteiniclasticum sediminis TaxID=2804028 RepID=A0A941HP03_9CLOT|nr:phosphate ABC transporter permease subunit PstC [Proteiniclasticum sediminis]
MSIRSNISKDYQKRKKILDTIGKMLFRAAGVISASLIVLIFVFIALKGVRVFLPNYEFGQVSLKEFLTGLVWRQDQQKYGVLFIVINTLVSAVGAAILSFPVSVLTALFVVKIAPKKLKVFFTTVVELLAAIPSVVYGVFAAGVIVKGVERIAALVGADTFGGNSLLAVIILLAIMIFPTMTSIAIVAIESVETEIELGSLALGASKTQTNFKVVLASAKSGIFAGLILGLGRAFGEATAVSMVAGNKFYGPTTNLFDITRTLTSTMLSGLKETTGLDYDIRFSVGIVLMLVIFATNFLIHYVKRRIGSVTNE